MNISSSRTGSTGNWGKFRLPVLQWRLSEDGLDGTGIEFVFIRTQTDTAPEDITTTDEEDATDDFVPTDWTDDQQGVNLTYKYEWAAKRVGSSGDWGKFSTPANWATFSLDGAGVEFVFIRTSDETAPSTPSTTTAQDEMDDFVPNLWTDDPSGVTASLSHEWVSERRGMTGDWSKFTTPSLWARYSTDGAGIEAIYRRTTTNVAPDSPATTIAQDETDDFVPNGWTDDLTGVDATNQYEWRSKRTGSTRDWGKFGTPRLQSAWAQVTQDQIDNLTLPRSAGWYFKFIDANTAVAIENLSETDAWPASAVLAANDATPGDNVAGDIVTIYRGEIASTRSWNSISMTWAAIASFVNGQLVVHGGISGDNIAARVIDASHLTAVLTMTTVLEVGDDRIRLDGRTDDGLGNTIQPSISVFDDQATPAERVRIGQLGAGTTDYGMIIRDRDGNNIITQDGLGIGVVGNVNITGEISASHISSDVLNVVTLWTGSESIFVNQSVGALNSDDVTITLDGDLDDHGMVFILDGQTVYAAEIDDIPTSGAHVIIRYPENSRSNYVGLRRNSDGDELTIYGQSQGEFFGASPTVKFTARRILGVKGPMPQAPAFVPARPDVPEIDVLATLDGFESSWLLPYDGGSSITGQQLEWKLATNNIFLTRTLTATDTEATVDTLAGGAFYHVRLRVTNVVGLVYSSTHKIFIAMQKANRGHGCWIATNV